MQWHGVTFDSITMGAYSMIACWAVFTVATWLLFENPPVPQPPHENGIQQPLLSEVRWQFCFLNITFWQFENRPAPQPAHKNGIQQPLLSEVGC